MRIGVVGLGRWGKKALREWRDLVDEGKVQLSVFDADEEQRKDAVAIAGPQLSLVTTDYDALLGEVDAVHICTPNDTHRDVAAAALQAGKHVLVEKPFTMDVASAESLVKYGVDNSLAVVPGHLYRGDLCVARAAAITKDHELGDPVYASARWTAKHAAPNRFGVIWDLLPHPVDALAFIWNEWPTGFQTGLWRDSTAILAARYPNYGALFELSWDHPVRQREISIMYTDGAITLDLQAQTIKVMGKGDDSAVHLPSNTIRTELEYFIQACRRPNLANGFAMSAVDCVRAVKLANGVDK